MFAKYKTFKAEQKVENLENDSIYFAFTNLYTTSVYMTPALYFAYRGPVVIACYSMFYPSKLSLKDF